MSKINDARKGSIESHSFDVQLTWLQAAVEQKKQRLKNDPEQYHAEEIQMLLSLAVSVKAARDHHLNCHRLPTVDKLVADPGARHVENRGIHTGIFVRAKLQSTNAADNGKWGPHDIADLTRESLVAWLRSRGGHNEWAEQTVLILLGHSTS